MKDFKVLFIYPNTMMATLVPASISILYPCLKAFGIKVELFDTTFYKTEEKSFEQRMSSITYQELEGLQRTFPLYARMPKEEWRGIAFAERFNEFGNRIFQKLREVYYKRYF